MRRPAERALVALVLASLGLVACDVATIESADPAAIPTGTIEPAGEDATGPVVELGANSTGEIGWRYSIYPSGGSWCVQLEMASATSAACGDALPDEGNAFGIIAEGNGEVVDGIVNDETHTVWLVEERGGRVPATMMSLEEAGLEGKAFVGFVPEGMTLTHLQAVARSGEVLETYEMP